MKKEMEVERATMPDVLYCTEVQYTRVHTGFYTDYSITA